MIIYSKPALTRLFQRHNYIFNRLSTFQKFDGYCIWWLPVPCLSCYILLGWCHGNFHGECAFVDLAIVPFSKFGSNHVMRAE